MSTESSVNDSKSPKLHDRSVWYGSELADRNEWIEHLSEGDIGEVNRAIDQLEKTDVESIASLVPKDIPLARLGPRLRGVLEEVMKGRGLC